MDKTYLLIDIISIFIFMVHSKIKIKNTVFIMCVYFCIRVHSNVLTQHVKDEVFGRVHLERGLVSKLALFQQHELLHLRRQLLQRRARAEVHLGHPLHRRRCARAHGTQERLH